MSTNTEVVINVPVSEPYLSKLLVNRRNELLYRWATTVIYPSYLLCFDQLLSSIFDAHSEPWIALVRWGVFGLCLLPILVTFFTPHYWHMGFKSRGPLYVFSLVALVAFALADPVRTLDMFYIVLRVSLLIFLAQDLQTARKNAPFDAWQMLL